MGRRWIILGLLLVWLFWPSMAWAHSGAPYPVLLEEAVGPYTISALADPDVGTGTFFVLIELAGDESLPDDTSVTVWVRPEDDHVAEAGYPAAREQTRYGERFVAEVSFDAEGPWQVRLVADGSAGRGETAFPVRVTPAGVGGLWLLLCWVPFIVLGALWLVSALRRRPARA